MGLFKMLIRGAATSRTCLTVDCKDKHLIGFFNHSAIHVHAELCRLSKSKLLLLLKHMIPQRKGGHARQHICTALHPVRLQHCHSIRYAIPRRTSNAGPMSTISTAASLPLAPSTRLQLSTNSAGSACPMMKPSMPSCVRGSCQVDLG